MRTPIFRKKNVPYNEEVKNKKLKRKRGKRMKITNRDKRTNLEKEIDAAVIKMSAFAPGSKEYSTIADNVETLCKAQSNEKIRSISPDTFAVVAGNLLGIALILGFEQGHVIASKALGFIIKGRV